MKQFRDSYLSQAQCEDEPKYLNKYLEKIYVRNKLEEYHSIYFPQVLFGKQDLIDLIFDQIGAINITSEEIINFNNYPIKVVIKQNYTDRDPKYQSSGYAFDFTFLIRSYDEYKYAFNMHFIYENLMKPFLNENKQNLNKMSELFRRFYYFTEPLKGIGYVGKSMGNPDKATFVEPHFSNGITFRSNENYLSHFRNRPQLNRAEVPITTMHIDFNYFMCYFIPIYESLMQINKLSII
jgi:hypothetical protein